MFIPAVIPAGDPYGWNNLTGTINGTNYSGTITFSSDVGGSSPITSVSGNIPGGGGNQVETIYAQGTITYTPFNPNQYRQADWLSQLQGLTTGSSNATFSNTQQGPVNGTTTYQYNQPADTANTAYR